jgi:fructose-specific phosphotransferase system IIA component
VQLFELLDPNLIFLDVPGDTREKVLKNIVAAISERSDVIQDPDAFYREVLEREKLGSTGIGEGVAIPHARTDAVRALVLTFARTAKPVDFAAEDKQPVRLIFLLAVPVHGLKSYLMTLARISRVVRKESVRKRLLDASSPDEIIQIIRGAEMEVEA